MTQTTKILIKNLHCSSCVRTIHDALDQLTPSPLCVHVSIVTQSVTVDHEAGLLPAEIHDALEAEGFDVARDAPFNHQRHVAQCSACKGADQVQPSDAQGLRVTVAISGMTCSSCSTTITRMVSQLLGVSDIAVSLLESSATFTVARSTDTEAAINAIEDCGFEAQLVSVSPTQVAKSEGSSRSLRIDGMFCSHCPEKVLAILVNVYGSRLTVKKPLTISDPVVEIAYPPSSLNIRQIIASLEDAKSPPFKVTVYRAPTLETLSEEMMSKERRSLLARLIFSIIVAIPALIIGMVYMSFVNTGKTRDFLMAPMWRPNTSRAEWALFIMATPVMFYSAHTFHRRSIKEILALWRPGNSIPIFRRFLRFGSMNLLVSSGVSVAYFASVALLGLAASQPMSHQGMTSRTTYFDTVVFLTMFLLAGRYLEAYSKSRTSDATKALGALRPADALLLVPRTASSTLATIETSHDLEKGDMELDRNIPSGFTVEKINVDLLEIGDIVRVYGGSTPPADGTIVRGETAFDESSLTGESRLIPKVVGDSVCVGTVNKLNSVDVRIDAVGGTTMLDQIISIVREGSSRRAPIERVADGITAYFVPVIVLIAIVTWLVWLGLGLGGILPESYVDINTGGWAVWSLEFAVAALVCACPCGIGLAAPTALLVGSGLAAKFGILARGGGEAFQDMASLDILVLDKTGTITEGGAPRVSDVYSVSDEQWPMATLLGVASELESSTSHPLAIAIRDYAAASNGALSVTGVNFEETAGRGLEGRFPSIRCSAIIGNELWAIEHGVIVDDELASHLNQWKSEAKSVVLLAICEEREPASRGLERGLFVVKLAFAVTDSIRSEAKDVIAALQGQGIGTWMLSGDNEITARAVARMVGIPDECVVAGVLPAQKAEKIEWLQKNGMKRASSRWWKSARKEGSERCVIAFVGDGCNDAPALTASDVGIAVGSGSDVAISSASFILLSSNLQSLLTLSSLSRKVMNRVKFNFVWAGVYNMIALPLAAGVFYPAGKIRLDPVWASLAMALSSVSVVCSSLLLKLYKEPKVL